MSSDAKPSGDKKSKAVDVVPSGQALSVVRGGRKATSNLRCAQDESAVEQPSRALDPGCAGGRMAGCERGRGARRRPAGWRRIWPAAQAATAVSTTTPVHLMLMLPAGACSMGALWVACTVAPRRLGLGAKYVPHHKAVGFAAALDDKLKKRLEAARKRGARAAEEEDQRAGAARAARQNGSQAAAAADEDDSDDEEEEDKGKARQVRQRTIVHPLATWPAAANGAGRPAGGTPVAQHHRHQQQQQQPSVPARADDDSDDDDDGDDDRPRPSAASATMSSRAAREALLFGAGVGGLQEAPGKKKKKKKKKKKNTGDEVPGGHAGHAWPSQT